MSASHSHLGDSVDVVYYVKDRNALAVALREIREMREKGDVEGLVDLLDSPVVGMRGTSVREGAANALGLLGDAKAVPALLPLLNDSLWKVRMETADALGKIGGDEVVPSLISALRDSNALVRMAAAESLGKLQATSAVSGLMLLLADDDRWCRLYAAEALALIGDRSVLGSVRDAAHGEHFWSRRKRLFQRAVRTLEG